MADSGPAGPSSEVRFDRVLYSEAAVTSAVEAFGGFASLSVSTEDDALVVSIADPKPKFAAVLADELANYALAETAAGRRG